MRPEVDETAGILLSHRICGVGMRLIPLHKAHHLPSPPASDYTVASRPPPSFLLGCTMSCICTMTAAPCEAPLV